MDYLYFLQCLRDNAPDFINSVFVGISESVLTVGPLLTLIIYWAVDKRKGQWAILSLGWM